MITFPQYESMFSMYLTACAIIPCVVLCFFGKKYKLLDLVISLGMIISFLGAHSIKLVEFMLFVACETVVIYLYRFIRSRSENKILFFLIFAASVMPLFVVRISIFKPEISDLIGFTGISYMCFKIWQLLFEIHDGKLDKLNIVDLWLFILFFPSFTSGPIARYKEFTDSVELDVKDVYIDDYLGPGLLKILVGLFYKYALSFFVNEYVILKIPEGMTAAHVIIYAYSYTLFLFFDFAGYSNIAIGVGKLMGITLPENFNRPFLARDMKEFWARWHMSLSKWFNDYVFGRFVLANVRNGLFKSTKVASRWAYLFTMLTMGLWHGFSLHYVIYGLYEGVVLVLSDFWVKSKKYRELKKKKHFDLVSRAVCFQFIAFGMLLFSGKYFFE